MSSSADAFRQLYTWKENNSYLCGQAFACNGQPLGNPLLVSVKDVSPSELVLSIQEQTSLQLETLTIGISASISFSDGKSVTDPQFTKNWSTPSLVIRLSDGSTLAIV